MDLPTITMDRAEARKRFLEYRRAVKERHDAEDEAIMRGYKALATGKAVIRLSEAISAAGVDERGLPRLAAMRADQQWCHVQRDTSGAVTFVNANRWPKARETRNVLRFPAGTLPRAPWGEWGGMRAMVPIVPPEYRPAHSLGNYHLLWEAEWAPVPVPPGDPALLRHIGGDLYSVVAIWDLTEIERAVLFGRRQRALS